MVRDSPFNLAGGRHVEFIETYRALPYIATSPQAIVSDI